MHNNLLLDRRQSPRTFSPLEFEYNLLSIKKIVLKNNTEVYYLHDAQSNVVQLDVVVDAGNICEEHKLVAFLCNQLLLSGTNNKSALDIDNFLEHYGVYLEKKCYSESASIGVKVLSKYLIEILPTLQEIFTSNIFPQHEIDLFVNKAKQSLLLNSQKADFIANAKINELLFGTQHPYGKDITLEDYDKITRQNIVNFYEQFYTNGFCKIFIAGNLPSNLEEVLNSFFGTQAFCKKNDFKKYPIAPSTKHKSIEIQNNATAVQSSIRLGSLYLHRQHPDYLKARILNIVLGGYFGSRLMKEVREKKGYTYGIYSYIQSNKNECAWIISSETGIDICKKALKAIYKEMEKLQQKEIEEAELNLVKNFYLGMILGDIEGALPTMAIWKSLILNEVDENYFYHNIHTIKTITSSEINALAIKYLDHKKFLELVVN